MEGKLRGKTENVNRRDADRRVTNDPSGPERKGIDEVVNSDRMSLATCTYLSVPLFWYFV